MFNVLHNIHINVNPIPVLRNLLQGSSTETGAASEAKHVGSHSRRSQDDTAGREGASIEQEAPAQNMRPYPTDEERRAKARTTIEHMDEIGSSRQTKPKSHIPLYPTTPRAMKLEVGALPQAGVPENEMRTGAGSSRHLESPAVYALRNFQPPPVVQGAGESRITTRLRSYDTTHDFSQRPPAPLPSVARSMSSHTIARDNQNPEVEQLKKQIATYKRENEKWAAERKADEVTVRDMTAALRAARAEGQRLHDELSKKKSENHSLRQEIEVSAGTSRSLGAKLQETESVLASTRQDLDAATNQLKAMSEQQAQLHTLLNDRTFELKGAQSFLTTADASSGADVISMLQRLNAEVLQSAAYMAESMVDTFSFESAGVVRNENAYEVVTGLFGQSLAHYLATKKHKDDPLLIQIAFQSCFIIFLEIVIRSLILPGEDVNRVLGSTYDRIRCGEAQAISGRWRALTNAYASKHEENQLIASALPHLTRYFSNIMLAAGCSVAPDILRASVEKKLSERIVLLFKLALQLNKIVMEEITSADLITVTVPFETTYSAEQMEDAYVDGDPATGGVRVLCTTDLGLRRMTRMATSGEKQWDDKLLLKPKVALKTVVDSMDG